MAQRRENSQRRKIHGWYLERLRNAVNNSKVTAVRPKFPLQRFQLQTHTSTSKNYLQTVPTLPTQESKNNSLFRKRAHELEKNIPSPALPCTYLTLRKSIPLFLSLCLQNRTCTALSLQILLDGTEGVHFKWVIVNRCHQVEEQLSIELFQKQSQRKLPVITSGFIGHTVEEGILETASSHLCSHLWDSYE